MTKITTTAASLTVAENAAATAIGIVAPTDPNYKGKQLTVTVNGLPSDGTVYLANGTTAVTVGEKLTVAQLTALTFKPTAGQSSQSSTFNYSVTDPAGLSATGIATLAIGAGTASPTTTAASLTVAENAGATAMGIQAPTDPNYSASQLTVTVNGLPSDGTVYLADGTTAVTAGETLSVAQLTGLTFKPTAGQFSQSSSFTYTVTDPSSLSAAGSASLAIGPDTTPPTTTSASLTVAGNAGPTAIGIGAPTDINYSAAQLTVTVSGLPSDGTVYLADGTTAVTNGETLSVAQLTGLTFKPAAGQSSQSSSFTYTVADPSGLSAAGSATLAIGAGTPPPTTTAASLTVAENAGPTAIGIAAPTDSSYSAAQLTVTVNGLPSDGTVYLADGTTAVTAGETLSVAQLAGLTFKPTAGQSSQSSSFTYTVKDPAGLSAAGSATLAIAAAPTTAITTTPASLTVAENAGPTAIGIAAPTDTNYAAKRLTATVNGLPSDGTVFLANGTTPVTVGEKLSVTQLTGLTFKPIAGQFSLSSSFTYTVTDPAHRSASGTAALAIAPDTTPPTTTPASLTVAENAGPTAIGIAAPTDPNFSAALLTVTVNGLPSDGTVYLADGTTTVTAGETLSVAQLTGLTFTPSAGQSSQSSTFTYTVKDPAGLSAAGSAALAIGAAATPPATTPASLTVAENAGPTAIGIAAPTDPNYSAAQLTVTVNGLPSDGTVYLSNGTTAVTAGETLSVAQLTGLTFKPTGGQFSQSSSFNYTVKDPAGLSASGSASLAIGPDTTPPTTTSASLTVAENAGPTAIGIAAPTDINYSASQLTVRVNFNGLPSDGTVYLADGTTPVTASETLSVTQLTGLTFKPTVGQSSQSSFFAYVVTDPAGLSAGGSATLEIAAPATPPTTTPTALIVAENAAPTFINIPMPTDATYSASQLTVTVNGLPSDGTVYLSDGTTAVTSGETLTVQQLLFLTFKPTPGQFSQSSSFTYTVKDPAGLSAAGSASLTIGPDTTPPKTTAALLTVLENAGPTAIGITAPTDINYSASQLAVTVNGLPTDGTVYLADGTTAVTAGEALSVAQLTGLTFKPTAGLTSQSSTFSYAVTDPSGLSTAGSATLAIGAPSPPTVTVSNVISGPSNSNNATLNGFDVIPPDNALAASASAIVMAENNVIEITSQTGAVIQAPESLTTFFAPWDGTGLTLTDPRALYDPTSGRFIVTADALTINNAGDVTGSMVLVAISSTTGPTFSTFNEAFTNYTINGTATWADQPTIASDGTNLYVTSAQFGVSSGQYVASAVTIIPLSPNPSTAYNLGSAADYRPVAVGGGSSYYVGYTGDALSLLFNGNGSTTFTSSTISLGSIDVGNGGYTAAQKGTSVLLDAGDGSIASTALAGNYLYAVFEVVPPGGTQPAVHWVKVDLSSNSLVAQGDIAGPGGVAAFNPSIAVDGNGDVLVNYTVSSSTMDPAAYASVMPAGSSSFLAPVLYGSSAAPETADFGVTNNVIRWGDYSSAVADPAAANTFVVSNELVPSAQSASNDAPWTTVTAEITLSHGASSAVVASSSTTTSSISSSVASTSTAQFAPLTASPGHHHGHAFGSAVAALDATNMPNFAPAFGTASHGGHGGLDLLVSYMASTFVPVGNGQGGPRIDEASLQTPLLTHPHAHG
jgi:large repetitive protein